MNTYRVIYVKKVNGAEIGKSALMTAQGIISAEMKFAGRHKNCRILSTKQL